MNSRDLVDPELLPLLDLWPAVTLDAATLVFLRTPGRIPLPPIANPERVIKTAAQCPGRDGAPDVPLVLYRPAGSDHDTLPCLYHMHGGGYVAGAASGLEAIHRELVETLHCALVSVDYRLAPETPFPGPIEDCYAGLAWVFANAQTLRIDARRIGIGGESAGGGLAATLALMVRDRGEYTIAFQNLIYPMIDDRTCLAPDPRPHIGEFVWNPGSNVFGWQCYLGHAPIRRRGPAHAAAARAETVAGLPPTFIGTGALDLFVTENAVYATRLVQAGVACDFHIYPGAFHGFDADQRAAVSRRMRRDSWDFLRRHLHP